LAGETKIAQPSLVIGLIVFLALAVIVYFGYALWTLWVVSSGLARRDATAISGYIDFPSVRTSLKEQLNTALLAQEAQEQQMSAVAAGLALAIFPSIINRLVDSYVTQSNIATLLSSQLNLERTSQSKYVIVRLISNISPISITRWRFTLNGVEIVCSFENCNWKVTDVIVPDLLTKIKRKSTLELMQAVLGFI